MRTKSMWTALGLYTLGDKIKEKKAKLRRLRRKGKEERHVIIPEEVFLHDPDYLPTFSEVKIQEQASVLDGCLSYEEEYAKFKYSMGGNLQFYDEHIALTSPRKKLGKVPRSPFLRSDSGKGDSVIDYSREDSRSSAMDSLISSLSSESMDMSLKYHRGPSGALQLSGATGSPTSSNNTYNDRPSSFRPLHHGHKDDTSEGAYATADLRNHSYNYREQCERTGIVRPLNIEDNKDKIYNGDQSSGSQTKSRNRDYSPIRTEARIPDNQDRSSTETKASIRNKGSPPVQDQIHIHSQEPRNIESHLQNGHSTISERRFEKINGVSGQNGKDESWGENDNHESGINSFLNKEVNKLDRTLMYVNQQIETLHNGDYNDLDIDLSDLSSDVFTDSEQPMTIPLSRLRPDTEFYPDSPTSEHAYSKTPCSTRRNSLNSDLSDDSLSEKDYEYENESQVSITRVSVSTSSKSSGKKIGSRENVNHSPGKDKLSPTKPKKLDLKNVKAKVGSTTNIHYKRGGGRNQTTAKKVDYNKKAKAKVGSFANFSHVPGRGRGKYSNTTKQNGQIHVFSEKLHFREQAEPRTDTHGVEAYSNLPAEFQEIARRLNRQEKELRQRTRTASGGSTSSERGRSRSRLSNHASSGGSSVSPDRHSLTNGKSLEKLSGSHNSSRTSVHRPLSRNSSLRERPRTPSLSRSHPATSTTPYDSRSRPTSRHSSRAESRNPSRSSSPTPRSRNSSPFRSSRSRGNSPTRGERRSKPPSRSPSSAGRSLMETSTTRSTTPISDIDNLNSARSVFQVVRR